MFKNKFCSPKLWLLLIGSITVSTAWTQDFGENRSRFRIHARQIADPIVLDGILDEQTWSSAEVAKDFFRVLPIDSGQALSQTEVRMAYDATDLYLALICYDTLAGPRPAESLRRDFSFGRNDNFLLFMDTYNDQTNGFSFGISAAGAQWDGLQADGGFVSLDWDCKWRSAIHNYPDRWVAEFAIPFRSIRYQNGSQEWGINFSRLDLKTAEKSSWAPVPRQFQTANLAFTGSLVFDEAPPDLGARFSLIPYVSGRSTKIREQETNNTFDAGLDAKFTLSTSLNLDLTVNPDFSQVEVDEQVTNLDRFELFFPERRQFFLENSDLFASLGTTNIRPFFSRRIGLSSPVQAGLRLSGKIGENTRIGLMNVQTGATDELSANNYSVAVVQQKVFERSNVGLFLVNRTGTNSDLNNSAAKYNRVLGIDYNLASADSRWTGKFFYHQGIQPEQLEQDFAAAASLTYASQRLSVSLTQERVGENYQADVGFVRRKGYYLLEPEISYKFFPQQKKIANHGPLLQLSNFFDDQWRISDRNYTIGYQFQMLDRSSFGVEYTRTYLRLLDDFDPTNTGVVSLPEGSSYDWSEWMLFYQSNARNLFNYDVAGVVGTYFNGDRVGFTSNINYRVQPYGSFGLRASYNRIQLSGLDDPVDLFLIGPKLDLTFTDKIFLTTYLQYNNQIDNVNLNVRFQWRYKPVSDFFLVYSSNFSSDDFHYKDRGLVAKISYYFN